jgi:hypothetical protein
MNTRPNRYFNDPNMAAAFSNLAGIFAPPSAQDFYAQSKTEGQDFQNKAIADAWSQMTAQGVTPQDQDRYGIAATLFGQGFNPSQSNRSVDIASADRRYGVDVGANTALATNRLDNETRLRGNVLGLAGDPSGSQAIDADMLAAITGVSGLPSLPGAQPVAPTDAQVLGQNRQSMLDEIPGLREALAADGIDASNVVTPNGPRMMPTGQAALQGQEPFVNRGAEAAQKIVTYRTPDGRTGTALFDPTTGSLVDQATGAALPEGVVTGNISDTAEGLTGAQNSRFQAQGSAIAGALDTIGQLKTIIQSAPASQGLVGSLRGTAQNVIQTGGELGRFFGGTVAEVADAVNQQALDAGLASEMFDTNIPAVDMLTNVLAWQYAKSFAGDRVSNEQLRVARDAIGGAGLFNNQANSLARLNQLEQMFVREAQRISPTLPPEISGMLAPYTQGGQPQDGQPQAGNGAPQSPPARPRAVNPQTGETVEWDGQTWISVQ